MKTVNAVRADALDLSPWGRLYDLADAGSPDVVSTQGLDWRDGYTNQPVVDGPTHLGMTAGPALSSPVSLMEHHLHTREGIAPIAAPIVVPVAEAPRADAITALLLQPGQCLMLNTGVWHAPALGIAGPSVYYWLAGVDQTVADTWVEITDGPVTIRADHV
ncbi:MAG: ureidoglycolate lyase [Actinobacteria bacterium]|nr:ureidoglycolate lyase [Actinomycetota bacterium]MCO5299385.1 ureidoglycolate lyase [Candidatus Nanopelagicales bacterium]HPQ85126.1 ureidoglycolate lyase [Actinomycetota bacterium]